LSVVRKVRFEIETGFEGKPVMSSFQEVLLVNWVEAFAVFGPFILTLHSWRNSPEKEARSHY
jgi:hypothetical protein